MGKNGFKRTVSVLVSALLIFTQIASVTGCNGKAKGGVKRVAKDSPWFNTTITELDRFKGKNVEYCNTSICGIYKDGILIYLSGWANDSNIEIFDYYNFNGELIKSIDASKELFCKQIEDVIISDDGIKIKGFNQLRSINSKETEYFTARLDLETGTLGELEFLESIPDSENEMRSETSFVIGDYSITHYEGISTESIIIRKDGQNKSIDLSAYVTDLINLGGHFTVSDKEIVFVCYSANVKFLSVNLETGEVKDKDEEYSWLNLLDYKTRIASFDGKTYITDQSGIKRINFDTKELEEAVSFNFCNMNRASLGDLRLLSAEGDRYVLAGLIGSHNSLDLDSSDVYIPTIVVLEKADKNPNAGKIIITAAAAGETDLSYTFCEAVRLFNNTNEKYIIQIDSKLRLDDFIDFSKTNDSDQRQVLYYSGASELGNQLAASIISGNGPDIILNADDFKLIQSEEYLLDLNSYVKGENGINEADYFSNVINAAKTDGKLFYMPLSFSVEGIATDKSKVREGQIGFTYDEYAKFVHEVCNGSDPMCCSQLDTLCELYTSVSDTCINGKEANFDNESFRALCRYVKDNVFYDPDKEYMENEGARYTSYSHISSMFPIGSYNESKNTLLGYPSTDGRGPMISVEHSIGISAFAPSSVADGVWEFIKFCMSEDIQNMIARNDNPMSLSAYDASAKIALENNNKSTIRVKSDESVIETYKKVLLSGSVIDNLDPAIIVVIREEMPPYFVDQKTLDDILPIINNRVKTIISERAT